MFELLLYAIGFFMITLLFRYLLHRFRKNGNRGKGAIWVGKSDAIGICVIGIVSKNINYLCAVPGFLRADKIGKKKE